MHHRTAVNAPPIAAPQGLQVEGLESSTHSGHRETSAVEVHRLLAECGIQRTERQIARLVRNYNHAIGQGAQRTLYDFLVYGLCMDVEQQRRVRDHPDYYRVITYRDPVGEKAVARVMRTRGR